MADARVVENVVISDPTTPSQIAAVDSSGRLSVALAASAATVTVDTELPAAAALADNASNPTAPAVGAFGMVFDGATWDRMPGNSAGGVFAQGNVASDAAVSGNPLLGGGRASTAVPSAVSADGDAVALWLNRLGAQKVVLVDDAGDSVMDGANDALRVNVVAGSAAGVTHTDDAAFTPTTDDGVPMFAFADETATDSVDEGDAGVVRMDTSRRLLMRIVGATDANRMDIDASGRPTVNVNGTVTVDSELPSAAALADGASNPTTPTVGAATLVYNGTTWDRLRGSTTGGAFVQGPAAADAASAGNPVLGGGRASSATPTAMSADGDAVQLWLDRSGGTIVNGRDAHDAALNANTNPMLMGGRASAAAPTDVSADGDAVRAWYLRSGAQATVLTAAGALIGGDATNGLDVDVTRVTGTVTVDTELPSAAALADATANPTVPAVGGFLMGYNGTTWDRVRTANTGRLQVDVVSGGGSDTPTTPTNDYDTSASIAAGSTDNHDTADLGGNTRKVAKVLFGASVPLKAELQVVENGSVTATLGVAFSPAGGIGELVPSHRNYWSKAFSANAGLDCFRLARTNLDASEAADVYSTIQYEA